MSTLLLFAIIAGVLLGTVLILAAAKPGTLRIQRSTSVMAPPEKIFQLINDFHQWGSWAPQDRSDSTMARTFSGPTMGKGAVSEWKGDGPAGRGRMEITDSIEPRRIVIKVDFVKPFEAHNINEFSLEPAGDSTLVKWSMQGTNPYFLKLLNVFIDVDQMMGKHFESGLENLRKIAER
jgi:uncharacterized protein YndB with AHSA1/START domain